MTTVFCILAGVTTFLFQTPAAKIPHLKDETQIIQIKTDPEAFLDKDVVLCGGLLIDDYYNFAYRDAVRTHYSLSFREVGATQSDLSAERYHLYLPRDIGKKIADQLIANAKEYGNGPSLDLVRVRVRLDPGRYFEDRQWNMLEVSDLQFASDDFKSWKPWYLEKDRLAAAAAKAKKDKDDRDAAADLIARIKASEQKQADTAAALEAAKWRQFEYPKGDQFKAKYAGITSGKVRLVKEDGSSVRIALDDLSKDERDWIVNKRWLKPVATTGKK